MPITQKSGIANRCEIMSPERFILAGSITESNPFVTFTFTHPETLPLPNLTYLRIHAACCTLAHMSGATRYLDLLYDGDESVYKERQAAPDILTVRLHEVLGQRAHLVESVQ